MCFPNFQLKAIEMCVSLFFDKFCRPVPPFIHRIIFIPEQKKMETEAKEKQAPHFAIQLAFETLFLRLSWNRR